MPRSDHSLHNSYVAATVLEITYGRRITSVHDDLLVLAERANTATNDCGSPGSMIVDFFPIRESASLSLPLLICAGMRH